MTHPYGMYTDSEEFDLALGTGSTEVNRRVEAAWYGIVESTTRRPD
ncbi:hypothetical protein M2271_005800 [Streptomyces sp. LBL]|nr:hypothetical protein [Streptomyces sp. LBL]